MKNEKQKGDNVGEKLNTKSNNKNLKLSVPLINLARMQKRCGWRSYIVWGRQGRIGVTIS